MSISAKPTFCPHCHSEKIIRKGTRKNQYRVIPLYLCKICFKYFSVAEIAKVKYPPHIILKALSLYNLGYSQSEVIKQLTSKYHIRVPQRTISSWLERYAKISTFRKLRSQAVKLYAPENMIVTKTLEHRQVYEFKIHQGKLTLLEQSFTDTRAYERLGNYLKSVQSNEFPHHLFQEQDNSSEEKTENLRRSSQLGLEFLPIIKKHKTNLANDLALFGLMLAKRNTERHQEIQDFMLINDSSTIACEVPVYLTRENIAYFHDKGFHLPITEMDASITGHIDIVQVRGGFIHILDYKPDAKKIKPVSQLTVYALALASHTKLPLKLFKCAWFDEKDYFEFYPLHCVMKRRVL